MKIFKLTAGLAIGYVLGTRAGRDKYDQIAAAARKAHTHPAVTQAQQKAKELLGYPGVTPSTHDAAASTPATALAEPAPRAAHRPRKPTVVAPDLISEPLA